MGTHVNSCSSARHPDKYLVKWRGVIGWYSVYFSKNRQQMSRNMMKRLSLHDFEEPHINENVTVTLMNGTPMYCNRASLHVETQPFAVYLRDYPDIIVTPDMLATRESARTIRAGGLFLPVEDSAFKKIASIWRENGFIEAVRATATEDPSQVTKTLHWISSRLKWVFELIERGTFRNELLPVSGSGSVADVTATRDWDTALVRCLSWHPHCTRLAVATRDDRIRIFSQDIQGVAVLRHSAQKSVCCMSWKPNAGRELAAACQSGVLIWTVELGVTSNSLSHAVLLRQRNHAPVTSVTWHPQGDLLVSCSPSDSNMIVWDVAKETCVPLKRVGGGGLCFARWSPCGWRLFAATTRTVFRIWNTGEGSTWSVDRWTIPNGRVAAACFGPNLTLLFTSTEDPATVFSLPLLENIFDVKSTVASGDVKVAIPLIDMTRVSFPTENDDDDVIVGGRVVAMDWDPSGKYLAVLFQDSPLIALFKTKVRVDSTAVEIRPGCLINGFPGEVPNCMHFYQNYDKILEKICLTIAWSSGRVQQFPIVDGASPHHSQTSKLMSNPYPRATLSDLSSTVFGNYSLLR